MPVNGTDVLRRAAEVAIAMHRPNRPVAALYVAPGVTDNPAKGEDSTPSEEQRGP